MSAPHPTRRAFVKRMAYVGPSVLTLSAAPEYAKAGSAKPDLWGGWHKPDGGGDWSIDLGGGKHDAPGGHGKGKAAGGKAPQPDGQAKVPGHGGKGKEAVRATAGGGSASGPASPEA